MHYFYLYPNPNFRQAAKVCLSRISGTSIDSQEEPRKPTFHEFFPADSVDDESSPTNYKNHNLLFKKGGGGTSG